MTPQAALAVVSINTSSTHINKDDVVMTLPGALVHLQSAVLSRYCAPTFSMTARIGLGFFVQACALVSAALIEMARYRLIKRIGLVDKFIAAGPDADYMDPEFIQPMR